MKESRELRDMAISLGCCEQGLVGWTDEQSQQELINRYKKFIDFCLANNYPGRDYIKQHFNIDQLHRNGIFVDEFIDTKNDQPITVNCQGIYVVLGATKGDLNFDHYDVATVYVANKARVNINISDFARINIRAYNDCEVIVNNDSICSVYAYRYVDGRSIRSVVQPKTEIEI